MMCTYIYNLSNVCLEYVLWQQVSRLNIEIICNQCLHIYISFYAFTSGCIWSPVKCNREGSRYVKRMMKSTVTRTTKLYYCTWLSVLSTVSKRCLRKSMGREKWYNRRVNNRSRREKITPKQQWGGGRRREGRGKEGKCWEEREREKMNTVGWRPLGHFTGRPSLIKAGNWEGIRKEGRKVPDGLDWLSPSPPPLRSLVGGGGFVGGNQR